MNIRMAVDSSSTTVEESLLNLFSPIRRTLVIFTFLTARGYELPVPFQKVKEDKSENSLRGEMQFTDSGNTITNTLVCYKQNQDDISGWLCNLTNSARGSILSMAFFKPVRK